MKWMHRHCRVSAVLALVALSGVASAAERKYGLAGCGLGSLIFKPSSSQSSAATTNGTAGSQTFGITSGTSNCTPGGKASAELDQQDFFVANFASLSKEIAQGGGETVVAFAGTLGCQTGASARVASGLQANYGTIFAKPGAVAAFDQAKDSLRTDPELVQRCVNL